MPDEAGGEGVKDYVAEGGRFRHVFQGYFQSSHAIQTSKLNGHSWTLNFVDAVVKHLESPGLSLSLSLSLWPLLSVSLCLSLSLWHLLCLCLSVLLLKQERTAPRACCTGENRTRENETE